VAGFEGGGHALSVALGARDRLAALGHKPYAAIRRGRETGIALVEPVRVRLRAGAKGSGPRSRGCRPPSRMTARGRLCASARGYRRRRWPPSVISA
jgi:hypothetical protein